MKNKKLHFSQGFSLIEVVLAAAIFMIFATSSVVVVLGGLNANRLGAEETIANQFATEGIEAVKSIKNQSYSNLNAVNPTPRAVFRNASNVWAFNTTDGSNNTLIHNSGDNYIRQVKVEGVNRDGSGNIVTTGGTTDPDTKKITSTVNWNFNAARPESVALITYLSDWRKPITVGGDAILVYLDNTSASTDDQPEYRTYTDSSNSFGSETNMTTSFTDTQDAKTFKIKTSPTKQEAIAGYVDNGGTLRILCFDGTTWSSEWTATVGGTGTNDQRFGIAYETNTGDALVVYSTNTATSNEMAYRTKAGSDGCGSANWPAATNITAARTDGIVHWIRMEGSPVASSNNIAVAWADNASDLSAMVWTGAGFTIAEPAAALETNLERVSASQDVQSFDIAFESTSGELMVVWGLSQATSCTAGTSIATTNCIRYAMYTTSWSAVAVIPTVADPATNIDISANPDSNELVIAALDNSQGDLSTAHWSGSVWIGRANVDTSSHCVGAGEKLVATGWLISGTTTRSIYVYHDATSNTCTTSTNNIGWRIATGNAATVAQTDFTPTPVFGTPQRWYDIQMDPKNKDRLMFTLSDNNSDLFSKRLVMTSTPAFTWSNADSSIPPPVEANLGQATTAPFGFAYWRNP